VGRALVRRHARHLLPHRPAAAAGYDAIPQTWDGWRGGDAGGEAARAGRTATRSSCRRTSGRSPRCSACRTGSGCSTATAARRVQRAGVPRGFEFYLSLFREGLAPPLGHHDVTNPYQEFGRGFFAMWITGPWNLGEFRGGCRRSCRTVGDGADAGTDRRRRAASRWPAARAWSCSAARGTGRGVEADRVPVAAGAAAALLRADGQPARAHGGVGRIRTSDGAADARVLGAAPAGAPLPAVPEIESIMSRLIEHSEASIRGGVPLERALARWTATDRILEKRRWLLDARRRSAPAMTGEHPPRPARCRRRARRQRRPRPRRREPGSRAGWFFIAPALVLIGVFFFVPVVGSLLLSLTDFDIYAIADRGNARFVGLPTTRTCCATRLLDGRAQHVLLRARRRTAHGRGLARGRAAHQRATGPLQGRSSARSTSSRS
jgi:hypothetical protein